MNILREGPKHLIIKSDQCQIAFQGLKDILDYEISIEKSKNMHDEYLSITSFLDDKSTVIMFTKKMEPKLSFEYDDFEYIAVVKEYSEDILIKLIRVKESLAIQDLRSTPQLLIMRTTGDDTSYIEAVNRDIKGQVISSDDMFEGYGSGTMIVFSRKKLKGPLDIDEVHPKVIYTQQAYKEVWKLLNNNRVKYVNASINNQDWSELIIKIYDSYELYNLHYKRISMILNELDYGLILGESWGKDAALSFLSVGVYQIRLFTYLDPLEIKKIAMALEYDVNGNRIVDYDLFTKRKKYSWTQVRENNIKKRDDLGNHFRQKLANDLSEDTLFELVALELKANQREE